MRIPSGKTDQVIYFVAVDSTDLKTRKTGLTTFTVYRSRNGGAATAYTTPTVAELSSANMPGVYSLLIDEDTTIASTSDSEEYVVHITQASMAPVTRTIELYRYPVTSGVSLSLQSNGRLGSNCVDATAIAAGSLTSTKFAAGAIDASAIADNAIDAGAIATGAITAAKFAAGALDAAALAADAGTEIATAVWANATRTLTASSDPSAATIAAAVWDEDATGHQTQGTFGQAIGDPALSGVSLRFLIGTPNTDLAGDISTVNSNVTGLNNLSQADIRTATGLASANLDTQLAAIPSANANADALLDRSAGVETGLTLRQWLRLAASVLFGKASGLATTTAVFRDFGDTKARVTATVDADGNRTAVTTDAT